MQRPAEEGGGGGAAAGAPGAGADDGNGNNNKKGGKGKGNKKGKVRVHPKAMLAQPAPPFVFAFCAAGTASPAARARLPARSQGGGQQQQPQQAGGEGGWVEIKHNTSVYINGLPDDVTVEELHEACSKYGLIKEDEHKQPRIKLYRCASRGVRSCGLRVVCVCVCVLGATSSRRAFLPLFPLTDLASGELVGDSQTPLGCCVPVRLARRDKATGDLKGDALVIFLKEPSVHLAVSLMDGTQLRPGQPNCPTMQVGRRSHAPHWAGAGERAGLALPGCRPQRQRRRPSPTPEACAAGQEIPALQRCCGVRALPNAGAAGQV